MALINKELIFIKKNFKDKWEALSFLADQLYKDQRVKSTFKQKVLDREKNYPTALPNGKIAVAIPHADWKQVKKSTLTFATLNKPVIFKNMGNPKEDIKVQIIIMLAIAQPKAEVKMLQKLMSIVQNQKHLQDFLAYKDTEELFKDVKQTFDSKVKN